MKKSAMEASVGIFVIIAMACVGYLTVKLGKVEWIGDRHYTLVARFVSVSGLTVGAPVEVAGVRVGEVGEISLDPKKMVAEVRLKIRKEISLSEDVIASVKTAGLIGDKFIKLTPGGSEELLKPGQIITETESALDIEELISKYVFGGV